MIQLGVLKNNEVLMPINKQIIRANADGGGVCFDIRRKEIFESLQMMRKLGIENNLKFWHHSFLCRQQNFLISGALAGLWVASTYGDYVFLLRNGRKNNNLPIGEYQNYTSTGNYLYVAGGYNGQTTNNLYFEVPDNVGVVANNSASFETYLNANPITARLLNKVYDISTDVNDSPSTDGVNIEDKRLRFIPTDTATRASFLQSPYRISTATSARFAISFWFKLKSYQNSWLVSQYVYGQAFFLIIRENGDGAIDFFIGTTPLVTATNIELDTWYKCTAMRGESDLCSLYINDNFIGSATQSAGISNVDLQIGGTDRSFARNTDSEIEDVRIYDTDLTASQITELYEQEKRNYE
jgi:hypothetical protein